MRAAPVLVGLCLLTGCAGTPPPQSDPRCDSILQLAQTGDHKPASDELEALMESGTACDSNVLAAVESSRARLAEADARLTEASQREAQGEYAAAVGKIRQAIEIYPRYEWARVRGQRLDERIDALVQAAGTEVESRLGRHDLAGAAATVAALGAQVEGLAARERKARALGTRVAQAALDRARLSVAGGDPESAAEWMDLALRARPVSEELGSRIVEEARSLGLIFFSDGQLERASAIWERALAADPENESLLEAIGQVRQRLERLEEIKGDRPPP